MQDIIYISSSSTVHSRVYLNLPKPTFLSVLIIHPTMEFIGTLHKSGGFRGVKVGTLWSGKPDFG